jgi:hypothetical protein
MSNLLETQTQDCEEGYNHESRSKEDGADSTEALGKAQSDC